MALAPAIAGFEARARTRAGFALPAAGLFVACLVLLVADLVFPVAALAISPPHLLYIG
jgi:hypothetical protein